MAPAATRTQRSKHHISPLPSTHKKTKRKLRKIVPIFLPPSLPFRKEKLVSFFSPFSLSPGSNVCCCFSSSSFSPSPRFSCHFGKRGKSVLESSSSLFPSSSSSSFARPLPSASGGSLFGRYRRRRSPFLAAEEEGGRLFSPAAAAAFSLFKRPVA